MNNVWGVRENANLITLLFARYFACWYLRLV